MKSALEESTQNKQLLGTLLGFDQSTRIFLTISIHDPDIDLEEIYMDLPSPSIRWENHPLTLDLLPQPTARIKRLQSFVFSLLPTRARNEEFLGKRFLDPKNRPTFE